MKRVLFFLSITLSITAYSQVDHWEQLVNAYDTWTYFEGHSEPPANWNTLTFNDSSWSSGKGSIGYGDSDDSTTIPLVPSIYMRKTFTIFQKHTIKSLTLQSDFDDGFVAYLNGVEIARANIADSLRPPAHDDLPMMSREGTLQNGANTYQGGLPAFWVIQDSIWKNALVHGTNVLAVHTLDSTYSWDLTTKYWLHCGTSSNTILHDSAAPWFEFNTFEDKLPILRINTYGKEVSQHFKIKAVMDIVSDTDSLFSKSYSGSTQLQTNIGIKKRGRLSLYAFPKNGYAFETKDAKWEDRDVEPLGLPEEEDWILHGPYADRSYIRNALAMHLARKQGNYASRTKMVELYINGVYEGIYVLMERIKRGPDRVDIAKLKPDEISGDDLTGGYIFKTDWIPVDWRSSFPMLWDTTKIPYTYSYPKREDIVPEQEQYIQQYVEEWETSMQNTSAPYNGKYWHEYMDMNSFVDFFLMMEVTKDVDAYRASQFYFKKKDSDGGKVYAGPVWDFNFAFGLVDYCQGYLPDGFLYSGSGCSGQNPAWWEKLVATPQFADAVNCRWNELRTSVWHKDSIMNFISEKELLLSNASLRNHARWTLPNGTKPPHVYVMDSTLSGDMNIMENWISARLNWLDSNMIGIDCNLKVDQTPSVSDLRIYPNPNTGLFYISSINGLTGKFVVRNMMGQSVYRGELSERDEGKVSIDLSNVKSGVYFIDLVNESKHHIEKVLIQH